MKANQNFRNADDAVSPVIGVILMVAITVVLAAVVFVLVSDLGEGGESAPSISFDADAGNDQITVVKADSNIAYSALAINCAGGADNALVNGVAQTGNVAAGDVITCPAADSAVVVTHTPTNSLLYSTQL